MPVSRAYEKNIDASLCIVRRSARLGDIDSLMPSPRLGFDRIVCSTGDAEETMEVQRASAAKIGKCMVGGVLVWQTSTDAGSTGVGGVRGLPNRTQGCPRKKYLQPSSLNLFLDFLYTGHQSPSMADTGSLTSFLESEANLIHEAAAALPHQFSKCTYSMGYIRQAVYLCLTCKVPRGLCSSCSIACHTDHEQVELFPKRHFRCDCPTEAVPHPCSLHAHPEMENELNAYSQNFKAIFCRCGRPYDAATERETMIQCVVCEVTLGKCVHGCSA